MLKMIIFEYPLVFLLIIPFIVCQILCKPNMDSLFFPTLKFLKKSAKKSYHLDSILKFLILFLLLLSLASPIIEDEISVKSNLGYEISLIIDVSATMAQHDKFNILKKIIKDFLDKRVHDKIGLSVFADFAYVATPLTYDKKSLKIILDKLEIGIAGSRRTALYEALYLSSNLFKNSHAKKKIAILLTDGINNVENIPLNIAIKTVQKYNIKVYTIGLGKIGDYDPRVLRDIAVKSGGLFYEANDKNSLESIYKNINSLEKSIIKTKKYTKKRYLYFYPLSLAFLLILLLYYRRIRHLL